MKLKKKTLGPPVLWLFLQTVWIFHLKLKPFFVEVTDPMSCEMLLLSRAPCRVSANWVPIILQFHLCLLALADSLNLWKESHGEMHRVAEPLPIHSARPPACFRLWCTSSYCITSVPEAGCGLATGVCFLNGILAHYDLCVCAQVGRQPWADAHLHPLMPSTWFLR